MKNLEEFIKQYFIFKGEHQMRNDYTIDGYDDNEAMIMIERDEIIEKPLSDTINKYGQRIDSEDAGDYTINNSACDALTDCIEDVCEHFSLQLNDMQINELRDIIQNAKFNELKYYRGINSLFNTSTLSSFVDNWKNDNERRTMCKCYEFSDGSNCRSVIFWDDAYDDNDIEEVDDNTYRKVYNEMFKNAKEVLDYEEIAQYIHQAKTKSYIFHLLGRLGTYGIKIFANTGA